ncbi:MAG: hypothetical protein WCI20_01435 [bacterium]
MRRARTVEAGTAYYHIMSRVVDRGGNPARGSSSGWLLEPAALQHCLRHADLV